MTRFIDSRGRERKVRFSRKNLKKKIHGISFLTMVYLCAKIETIWIFGPCHKNFIFVFFFCTDVLLTGSISKFYHNKDYVTCNNNPIKLTYRTWTSLESRNLPFSIQFPCWEMQLFQILRRNYIVTNVVFASISHTMSQLGIHSFRAIM